MLMSWGNDRKSTVSDRHDHMSAYTRSREFVLFFFPPRLPKTTTYDTIIVRLGGSAFVFQRFIRHEPLTVVSGPREGRTWTVSYLGALYSRASG